MTTIRRLTLGVCVGTVLVTALAVALFVHFYRGVVEEAFRERSAAYVAAFADAVDIWLASGDEEMIKTAARFLLVGSALYVQVFLNGSLLIDERVQAADRVELPMLSSLPSGRTLYYSCLERGPTYLDVTVPYTSPGAKGETGTSGYIRIGINASSVTVRTRNMGLIAAGIGAFFDLFILGAFFLAVHRLRKAHGATETGEREMEGLDKTVVVELGPLRIDETKRKVTLSGEVVPLPPKQYSLLRLLASDAGRVFSDKEILAAVWPESEYADSKDVKQCVYLLRRRLEKVEVGAGKMVVNVPRFGYRLAPPATFDRDLTDS